MHRLFHLSFSLLLWPSPFLLVHFQRVADGSISFDHFDGQPGQSCSMDLTENRPPLPLHSIHTVSSFSPTCHLGIGHSYDDKKKRSKARSAKKSPIDKEKEKDGKTRTPSDAQDSRNICCKIEGKQVEERTDKGRGTMLDNYTQNPKASCMITTSLPGYAFSGLLYGIPLILPDLPLQKAERM